MVEHWNSDGGTVWWNSEKVMVEQWNSNCNTVWWNSAIVKVELSWKSGTVMVNKCGWLAVMVGRCGGTV